METTSGAPQTTPNVDLIQETEFRVYDGLLATGLCICLLIGLPGNLIALKYFIHTKKRNLSTLLYILACCIDIFSSIIHLPVAINFFNKREAGLFNDRVFCIAWYLILLMLQQMSMVTVTSLSVSRTIVIIDPFYQVNKKSVFISISLYFFYHLVWNLVWLLKADELYYDLPVGFCQAYSENIIDTIFQINFNICSVGCQMTVLLSFLASVYNLRKNSLSHGSEMRNLHASITIAYFSALFLACNLFTLINCVIYTVSMEKYDTYPGPLYNGYFMFFYSWPLSELFFIVLNASLNPLLYQWRMKEMRIWFKTLLSLDQFTRIEQSE